MMSSIVAPVFATKWQSWIGKLVWPVLLSRPNFPAFQLSFRFLKISGNDPSPANSCKEESFHTSTGQRKELILLIKIVSECQISINIPVFCTIVAFGANLMAGAVFETTEYEEMLHRLWPLAHKRKETNATSPISDNELDDLIESSTWKTALTQT